MLLGVVELEKTERQVTAGTVPYAVRIEFSFHFCSLFASLALRVQRDRIDQMFVIEVKPLFGCQDFGFIDFRHVGLILCLVVVTALSSLEV